jgi:hypothetical protein
MFELPPAILVSSEDLQDENGKLYSYLSYLLLYMIVHPLPRYCLVTGQCPMVASQHPYTPRRDCSSDRVQLLPVSTTLLQLLIHARVSH